jgi:hypothetical protein
VDLLVALWAQGLSVQKQSRAAIGVTPDVVHVKPIRQGIAAALALASAGNQLLTGLPRGESPPRVLVHHSQLLYLASRPPLALRVSPSRSISPARLNSQSRFDTWATDSPVRTAIPL